MANLLNLGNNDVNRVGPISLRVLFGGSWLERATALVLLWISGWLFLMVTHWQHDAVSRWMTFYDLPLGLFAGILSIAVWRDKRLQARTRRAWALIALYYLSSWIGNCIFGYYEGVLQIEPFPSIADFFFLIAYPSMFVGLLFLSEPLHGAGEKAKFTLDAATVMVAALAFIAYFVLPHVGGEEEKNPFNLAIAMAYPLGDSLLVFGIVSVLLKRQQHGLSTPVLLLLSAQALTFVADIEFILESAAGSYQSGGMTDIWFLLSFTCIILAALDQYRRGVQFEEQVTERRPYPYRVAPYFAVFAGYGLLAHDYIVSGRDANPLPLLTVFVLTCLVIARQFIAARDIALLHAAQAERRVEHRFGTLIRHSSDVVLVTDADGAVRFASPSVERTLGWPPETLQGCNLAVLMHHDDIPAMSEFLRKLGSTEGVSEPVEYRMRNRDDSWQHMELIASNLVADQEVGGLVLNCRDVTDRRGLEDRLRHMAFHDPLTMLPNRNLFNERVQISLQRVARQEARVAVMFVDLDNFKTINDSLGHEMGDNLLVAVAERLRRAVRPDDTVARLGGDEFAVLVEDFKATPDLATLAMRMSDALNIPVYLAGKSVTVSGSIGIAIANAGDDTQDLLRNADVAMYRAKAHGKGGHEFFEASMHAQVLQHLEVEMDVRRGLQADEFTAHYQPVVDLQANAIIGVEALVRWRHPQRGLVTPGAFISVAEGSDLIAQIGRRVLVEACTQGRRWQETFPQDALQYVSVNISARQLQSQGFVDELQEIIQHSGIRPESLVLEITESMLMEHVDWSLERLLALRKLGVRLALDDFGTGYSALSYLHQFPFDILKIDRSFISKISEESNSDALVRAIVAMGNSLGMSTIAEGIETTTQLAELRRLGCHFGQGFYFSRAVPSAEIGELLANSRKGSLPHLTLIAAIE